MDSNVIQIKLINVPIYQIRIYVNDRMSKYSEAIRKKYSELQRQSNSHYDNLYKEWMNLDKDDVCDSHLHESNIRPTIRFIHERNIQPANWIRIALDEDELDQSGLF